MIVAKAPEQKATAGEICQSLYWLYAERCRNTMREREHLSFKDAGEAVPIIQL